MKYFTGKRYQALQNFDQDAMDRADADWEKGVSEYESYLQTIRPELPESVRQLLDGFYLHDAQVLSMGRRADTFVVVLQLDVPPNELLLITYELSGAPDVDNAAFPAAKDPCNPGWLYEEIELLRTDEGRHFRHSILLSNGWEIRIPFRNVQLDTAVAVFPFPRTQPPASAAHSA